MGGVARRATALAELSSRHPETPILIVETGNSLKQTDDLNHPMNPWILRAFGKLGNHGINTTLGELRRLSRMAELNRLPAGGSNFIASMVKSTPAAPYPVKPYVVQSLRASAGDVEVRVGILAVSAFRGDADAIGEVLGVREALQKYVPIVDEQSDILVLLSRLEDSDINRLAGLFPAIDVVVNGNPIGEGRTIGRVGNTVMVESAHDGIALGVLELSWDADGKIQSPRNQFIPLPPVVEESPALAEIVGQSQRRLMEFYRKQAGESPDVTEPSVFAGADACRECHSEAFGIWKTSAHAHAIDSLSKNLNEYNPDCLPCHVTAFDADRGFTNILRTPKLANVQCEACHSAALEHSKDPENIHPGIGMLQQIRTKVRPSFCLRCHTQDNSPLFNHEEYWPKIAH